MRNMMDFDENEKLWQNLRNFELMLWKFDEKIESCNEN